MARKDLIHAVNAKFREMSIETIVFHQAVADTLGLHITDHKSLDLIHHFGAMSAGRLAELTGLTTGAATRLIDRLEGAGYVRRTNDPTDRRRTIIEAIKDKKIEHRMDSVFVPLHQRTQKILSGYSDNELALLSDVTSKFIQETRAETQRLRKHHHNK